MGQRDSRLGGHGLGVGIDPDHIVHLLFEIEHDRFVDRLAGKTGAAAAREDRNLVVGAVLHDRSHVGGRGRDDDADRELLVRAGVGRIQVARVAVEANLAVDDGVEVGDELRTLDLVAPVVVVGTGVSCRLGGLVGCAHDAWWLLPSRPPT